MPVAEIIYKVVMLRISMNVIDRGIKIFVSEDKFSTKSTLK